jgi:hypothetical protein
LNSVVTLTDYGAAERLEALLHGFQIVALPHPAHAGRRDRMAALAQLVGDTDLAEGGLFERQVDDDRLESAGVRLLNTAVWPFRPRRPQQQRVRPI